MPLSGKKQKAVQKQMRFLIFELNAEFAQDSAAVLAYLKLAVDLPDALTEVAFTDKIASLEEDARECLKSIRFLYKSDTNSEDMKAAVRDAVQKYEQSLKPKASASEVPIESKQTVLVATLLTAPKLTEETEEEVEQQLARALDLKPGDIVISEMPYVGATGADYSGFDHFQPGHSSVWTGADYAKPFAHAVREGYRPPGLKLSKLWDGRYVVFRYAADPQVAELAASIIRNWASAEVFYTLESYKKTYPMRFWDRYATDLINYFGVTVDEKKHESEVDPKAVKKTVAGPATAFGEPRATTDLSDLQRDKSLAVMGGEGLRRAIKFASLRELTEGAVSKKGQRCSPLVVAAFQAGILAPIVVATAKKEPFKQFKGKSLLEYADLVLIPGWNTMPLGQKLIKAVKTNDFSGLFPPPFNMDQRYATPMSLYAALKAAPGFELVGRFNYYKKDLVRVERTEKPKSDPAPKKPAL